MKTRLIALMIFVVTSANALAGPNSVQRAHQIDKHVRAIAKLMDVLGDYTVPCINPKLTCRHMVSLSIDETTGDVTVTRLTGYSGESPKLADKNYARLQDLDSPWMGSSSNSLAYPGSTELQWSCNPRRDEPCASWDTTNNLAGNLRTMPKGLYFSIVIAKRPEAKDLLNHFDALIKLFRI